VCALLLLLVRDAGAGDLKALRKGVRAIAKPGVPGPVALTGGRAFAVVVGEARDGTRHAAVAAARFGKGRVVAFGHGGYLTEGAAGTGDTATLLRNAFDFACGPRGKERVKVALVGNGGLAERLSAWGFETSPLSRADLAKRAADFGVLVVTSPDLGGAKNERALREFVEGGGGLVTAGLAWGWKQLNPRRDLARDHRLNAVLAPMGLFFADGYTERVPVLGDGSELLGIHAGIALADLATKKPSGAQEVSAVATAYRSHPEGASAFRTRVRKLVARGGDIRYPVKAADAAARLSVLVRHLDAQRAPPEEIRADASAADFPGAVPKDAARVEAAVRVDLSVPGWAGTGLYVPPGEVVRIELPAGAPALRARIGCHTDGLWGKGEWRRHPGISREFSLGEGATPVASPHGGLLYLVVPARAGEGSVEVGVEGAVRAPRFVLGETDPIGWRREVRARPAPWAEFEAKNIVLTVPSDVARRLDDPTELMEFWDEVLELYAELGMRPLDRRPQRLVPDRQISAGWLHAGYPIMMQMLHADMATDLAKMRDVPKGKTGAWGFWHELGHNHQRREWTFGGTTEVTCNLFSLYVDEHVRGIRPADHPWPKGKWKRVLEHVRGDRSFERWKREPGLALWMYILVQDEFGWDAFRKTFAEYEALPKRARPRTDAEKRDQWLVRLSRNVGRDLGPYFEAWGVPTSKEARASLDDLEPWMPESLREEPR